MDLGRFLDTSFGRLRIQLILYSLLSPVFLPFFSPGFTHRLLRGRRFAVPEVERFPWICGLLQILSLNVQV